MFAPYVDWTKAAGGFCLLRKLLQEAACGKKFQKHKQAIEMSTNKLWHLTV